MDPRLSLVLFSGTDDKLNAAAVLTAGAAAIRASICERLAVLGVAPELRQADGDPDGDAVLSRPSAAVAVLRIAAREDLVIGREVFSLLSA